MGSPMSPSLFLPVMAQSVHRIEHNTVKFGLLLFCTITSEPLHVFKTGSFKIHLCPGHFSDEVVHFCRVGLLRQEFH